MQKALFAFVAAGLVASAANAANVNLTYTEEVSFQPVSQHITSAPAEKASWQSEWFDTWFADGGGSVWYTPEDYSFATGDTLEVVVFINLDGGNPDNFIRYDGFYPCGSSNPLGYVQSSGAIDFGTLPANQPNYGWITGVGYVLPQLPSVRIDSASMVKWNGNTPCGVPLSGRPDCAQIN